jgi:O-methyltransferase involved in polyketide biosynthesis
MTQDPDMVYVETDLEGIMQDKMSILDSVPQMKAAAAKGRVFFHTVDALSFDQIEKSLTHFDPSKPVAVIHEGLYQYLSMNEKSQLANNIRRILQRFDGAWITPDFSTIEDTQKWFNGMDIKSATESIIKLTGRDFADRAFTDQNHVDRFISERGFQSEVVPQIDGSFTFSCLNENEDMSVEIDRMQDQLKLWIVTLNKGAS